MAIDKIAPYPGTQPQRSAPGVGRPEERRESGPAPTVATGPGGDTVSLTEGAARLRQLEEGLAHLPVVDEQKVAEIRQALQEGRLEIDPLEVARKMLDFEAELSR